MIDVIYKTIAKAITFRKITNPTKYKQPNF